MSDKILVSVQAKNLVERVLQQQRRGTAKLVKESYQRTTRNISGTAYAVIGDTPYEYGYEAKVTLSTNSYQDKHPYGMGTASERGEDFEVEDVEIIDSTPLDGGPEENEEVTMAIIAAATKQASEL